MKAVPTILLSNHKWTFGYKTLINPLSSGFDKFAFSHELTRVSPRFPVPQTIRAAQRPRTITPQRKVRQIYLSAVSVGYLCVIFQPLFAQLPRRGRFLFSARHKDVFFFEGEATGHGPGAVQKSQKSRITSLKSNTQTGTNIV